MPYPLTKHDYIIVQLYHNITISLSNYIMQDTNPIQRPRMNYNQFKTKIQKEHVPTYYQHLLQFSNEIVEETIVRKHHLVAKDLRLSQSKFSNILPLLVAYRSLHV